MPRLYSRRDPTDAMGREVAPFTWREVLYLALFVIAAFEATDAREVLKEVDARQKALDDQTAAKTAMDAQQKGEEEAKSSRSLLVQQSLRDLGYDFEVSPSETAGEVVITAAEFDDTDHRVRFLAFLRNHKSPVRGLCFGGFTKVRLRSSRIPLVGFDESYSLECSF